MNRRRLASFFVATIAIGGASRLLPIGAPIWDKSVGDGAYAAMVFFMLAFLRPRARSFVRLRLRTQAKTNTTLRRA